MLATLLVTTFLAAAPPQAASVAVAPAATGGTVRSTLVALGVSAVLPLVMLQEAAGEDWLTRLLGDEDLLMLFQIFAGLGVASAVGVVALIPAHLVLFGLIFVAVLTSTPALVLAGPAIMLAIVVVTQALAAGIAVWAVALTSDHFRPREYAPGWFTTFLKDKAGIDAKSGIWGTVVGAPWLTGFGGYLAGAGLGMAAGMALAVPLLAGSAVLLRAPVGNFLGIFAMLCALTVGGMVVAAAETFMAPVVAALAHHLTKEIIPDPKAAARSKPAR